MMISSAIIPQPLARLPWRLIWLVALICTIGVVTLFSAAGGSWSPWALKQGVTILAFFGLAIGVVGCYKGFTTEKGTEGVGRSAHSSVVVSSLLIFVLDLMAVQITESLGLN